MEELIRPAKNHRNLNSTELFRRRVAAGLTQRQLAEKVAGIMGKVSLSQVYIAQCESLTNPDVPIEFASALEAALKI